MSFHTNRGCFFRLHGHCFLSFLAGPCDMQRRTLAPINCARHHARCPSLSTPRLQCPQKGISLSPRNAKALMSLRIPRPASMGTDSPPFGLHPPAPMVHRSPKMLNFDAILMPSTCCRWTLRQVHATGFSCFNPLQMRCRAKTKSDEAN